ncbi:MAG: hypothetical protein ACR2JW_19975 [Thermomicrobiales bacterium]
MMVVPRRTFLPLLLIALLLTLGTSSVLAKDKDKDATSPVSGASMGASQVTNPTTCNPPSQNPNFLVCNFDVSGTYTANPPLGPAGTYSGHVTLDYHSYTAANRCATASGTITFTNTATGDKLNTTIDPAHSQVCETGNPVVHSENLVLKITGGTGAFTGATGTIMSNGSTTDVAGNPGQHTDSATLTGSITLEHGKGTGCGNDGHNNGHGNGGDDNGHGNCGNDHGDGHGGDGGDD